jgi:prolipoprotein diacylglyceryltransferase
VPIAILAFDFDPVLRLADGLAIRWQTVVLVVVVAAGLVVAGLIARRNGLRADDLLFIAVAVVPGAVIGGRAGHVLMHLDFYSATTTAIADPGVGSMELVLAVVGGTLSGSYVASLLGAPIDRWLGVAALPLLFVLGAGKLAMVLGGAGQGQPSGLPWATAYLGVGPWGSLAPDLPSHPTQAYEGIVTLAMLAVLGLGLAVGAIRLRDGRLFLAAIALWAAGRAVVSLTWRDDAAMAGLSTGGLIAVFTAIGCLGLLAVRWRPRTAGASAGPSTPDVRWADPETRPRF